VAQDYDVVLKLLFPSKSSRAVEEIAGGPVKRWLDKELPAIRNTRADLIGETAGGDFVHLEFMSINQTFIELRMAGYYVEIYLAFRRHPRQALIYVGRASGRQRRLSGRRAFSARKTCPLESGHGRLKARSTRLDQSSCIRTLRC